MVFVLPCSILIILQSHTGRSTQCSQDSRCDRCNQLHNKLSCLFFIHNFLLSLLPFYLFTFNLILGAALRLNCPQVEINRWADRLQDPLG